MYGQVHSPSFGSTNYEQDIKITFLHPYAIVGLVKNFIHLINAWNMEHVKTMYCMARSPNFWFHKLRKGHNTFSTDAATKYGKCTSPLQLMVRLTE